MKRRRILGMIIGICLLFSGCGTDNENTDASLQEQQSDDIVAKSASEETEIGKEGEQTEEDAESEDETEQTEEGAEKEETSWSSISYMEAYRRFLEVYLEESEFTQFARVTLALIDDDNVPELILIEDNSHAAGVKVYTYYQESVIELGEFGSSGWMQYAERGGMILSGFTGHGECDSDFFQVEDGEAKLVCSLMSYEQPDGLYELYEIDGASVTEEAHDKKWEELYDAYEYVGIGYDDAFAMQDAEIADVLAEVQNALLLQQSKALEGQIEKYGGEIISQETFEKLSGTNLIEEIKAEGYIVGDIIRWDNDIVTINYEKHRNHNDSTEYILYENVIWDNNVKDFWRKEERNVTSWKGAGEGGSYRL